MVHFPYLHPLDHLAYQFLPHLERALVMRPTAARLAKPQPAIKARPITKVRPANQFQFGSCQPIQTALFPRVPTPRCHAIRTISLLADVNDEVVIPLEALHVARGEEVDE